MFEREAEDHQNPRAARFALARAHRRRAAKVFRPLRGGIRKNWNDTEKISMAPAQG